MGVGGISCCRCKFAGIPATISINKAVFLAAPVLLHLVSLVMRVEWPMRSSMFVSFFPMFKVNVVRTKQCIACSECCEACEVASPNLRCYKEGDDREGMFVESERFASI